MFDCGPASTLKMVRMGLRPQDVTHLFFTHHHSDHNADYPCFLLTHWEQSRSESQLRIYGPPPTTSMTEKLVGPGGVFWADINARINDPGSKHVFVERGGTLPRPDPCFLTKDISAGTTIETDEWRVTAGHAQHAQPYLECLAYRIETEDVVVTFTGDTGPCAEVSELASGSDLLLCMCWDEQTRLDASGASRLGCVCGSGDAARLAKETNSRQLVLMHSTASLDDAEIRAEAHAGIRDIYKGAATFAYEGLVLRRIASDGLWVDSTGS